MLTLRVVRLVLADGMKCNVMTECNEDREPDVDSGSDSDLDSVCKMDIKDSSSNGSNSEDEYASSVVNNNVRQREDNLYVISQKRHYRTEVEKLHDSLSKSSCVKNSQRTSSVVTYIGVIDCCIMLFCSSFHIMQSIVVHIFFL